MTNFLKVNCNLTSTTRETREFRLPRVSPFPKLDRSAVVSRAAVRDHSYSGTTMIAGSAAPIPEMATDVIDSSVGYSVENVRRMHGPRSKFGVGRWVGRILGGHRVER
jgi:hypothetical protein